jgi:hypothetical protein
MAMLLPSTSGDYDEESTGDKVEKEVKTKPAPVCSLPDSGQKALPAPSDNNGKGTAVVEADGLPPSNTTSQSQDALTKSTGVEDYRVTGFFYDDNGVPLDMLSKKPMTRDSETVARFLVNNSQLQTWTNILGANGFLFRLYPVESAKGFIVIVYKTLAGLKYFERDRAAAPVNLCDELEDVLWPTQIKQKEGQVG